MVLVEIHNIREEIDSIDREILILLDKRVRLCREIGEIKKKKKIPVTDKHREVEVLRRAGVFRSVFREIIRVCKSVQE